MEDEQKPPLPYVRYDHDSLWKLPREIPAPEPTVEWRLNYNDRRLLRRLGIDPEN
jgi:hypothetical protein